jgi:hypothetical protein
MNLGTGFYGAWHIESLSEFRLRAAVLALGQISLLQLTTLVSWHTQSANRGRGEIEGVYLPSQLELIPQL